MTAYIPSAAGPIRSSFCSSGFFQNGVAYAPYAHRLASWGIVTFLRDDPNLAEGTPTVASDVSYMVATWLAATNADTLSALQGKVDTSKVGLAGHSRGGQIALLAAEGGAKGLIHGVFGLDPVDTSMNGDPGGADDPCNRRRSAGVHRRDDGLRGLVLRTGREQLPGALPGGRISCLAITAVDADHTMFEDPANCSFCTLCIAGTAKPALVLATAVRYLTAFFARQLLGDTTWRGLPGSGANQDVAAGIVQIVSK